MIILFYFAEHSHEASSDSELVKHLKGIIKVYDTPFSFFCFYVVDILFVEISLLLAYGIWENI